MSNRYFFSPFNESQRKVIRNETKIGFVDIELKKDVNDKNRMLKATKK